PGPFLEQFCSKPMPEIQVSPRGQVAHYTLIGDTVGMRSSANVVHATLMPAKRDLYRSADSQKSAVVVGMSMPARKFIFDVLLHEGVFPGQEPTLELRQTVGVFNRDDDADRFDVIESIQPLGKGIPRFRAADSQDYQDILHHVCEHRQWDSNKLRGYRCQIEYPVYSSEIAMTFDLPAK